MKTKQSMDVWRKHGAELSIRYVLVEEITGRCQNRRISMVYVPVIDSKTERRGVSMCVLLFVCSPTVRFRVIPATFFCK